MSNNSGTQFKEKIRLLLIDDEEPQLELTKLSLEDADPSLTITTTPTPYHALRLLSDQPFDCIVSDYQMPGMNGVQLCTEVRKTNTIPFIIYTGRGSEEVASTAFDAGVDDYVKKEKDIAHYQILARRIRHTVERKWAEEARKESEEKYRIIVEAAQEGILVSDTEGKIIFSNQRMAQMLGYSVEDLIGKSGLELASEAERTRAQDMMKKRKRGVSETYEIWMKRRDGGEVCMLVSGVPLLDSEGRHTSNMGMYTNVTARKRLEEQTAEQLQMLDHANVLVKNMRDEIIFWNIGVERFYGYSQAEAVGKVSHDLLRTVFPEPLDRIKKHLLRRGEWNGELIHTRKDGGIVNVASHWVIYRDKEGEMYTVIENDNDITEQKMTEEELRASNEELAALNEELLTTQEELRASNEELSATEEELRASNDILTSYMKNLEETVEERTREIKETKDRLETFMAGATDGFSIYDSNLKLLDVNDAWLMRLLMGLSKVDVIGKNMTEIYPGIEDTIRYREFLRVMETGVPFSYEGYLTGSLVKRRYYQASVFKVGAGLGIVSRDITEKMQTQEALREAKDRQEAFVESVSDPFVIWSHDLNLVESNRAFLGWFPPGIKKADLIGKNIKELAPGAESHERYPVFLRVLETGEPAFLHNVPSLTGYGDRRFDVKAFKLGEGIGVINYDITEHIKADEKLREASLYVRSLIEVSLDPLVTISAEGKITDVNEATVQATGVARNQMINTDFAGYFSEPEKARQGYQRAFKEGSVIDYPLVIRHSSGKIRDVLYNAIVYRDENGEVKGVFAAARDVTERRRLEAELLRAERMEAVGKLTAMLAHDLRNPLNFISLASEMARRQPDKADRLLQLIGENAGRSLKMIEEVRTNTREINLQRVDTDMASLIRKLVEETRIPEKIKLEIVIGKGLENANLDSELIRRVLDNLVSNAIEAMPDGGKMTISASLENGTMRIDVDDTGIGIPADIVPMIFDPFYSTKPKGLGLGLPFSKRVIEAHGGTLSFITKHGVGTTFTTKLPLRR